MAYSQTPDQGVFDKGFGTDVGQKLVEAQQEYCIDRQLCQTGQFFPETHQAGGGPLDGEIFPGLRFKQDDYHGQTEGLPGCGQLCNHPLMPQMYAVEIADGGNRSLEVSLLMRQALDQIHTKSPGL